MKKLKFLLAILICLATSQVIYAQRFGPGDGLVVTYQGCNTAGQFHMGAYTNPSTISHIYDVAGDNYIYNSASIVNVTLSYYYPFYGMSVVTTVPIASINSIPMFGSQVFGSGCYTYTITKGPGYSVVGATYNYTLSVSVHNYCP